jgi:hypothetical protein
MVQFYREITSDRAGVVPPSFRRKTTLQYKSLPPIAIPARFVL